MLKTLFSKLKSKSKRRTLMKHFSQEYLEHLQNEHRLTTASMINLRNNYRKYLSDGRNHTHIEHAINQLEFKRVDLESKIDVLTDFLNG